VIQERLNAKDRNLNIEKAKIEGVFAYALHFGDLRSGLTWKRLLAHEGQFPPTRNELNQSANL
jgi:hypothetical protein